MNQDRRMQFAVAPDPQALVRGRASVGKAEIIVCTDGTCRFDGGAMFGVVPRTLWSKVTQSDPLNRVTLGLNCVLIRIGGKTVLIETGFGNKLPPKLKEVYGVQEQLPASLQAAGTAPADVDFVINTHLHWDHCGWNTVVSDDGEARAFFPNATYVMHAGEVEHGRRQTERDGISYVAANYEPLLAEGKARLVDITDTGETEQICAGVSVECFPGHTRQMLAVHVESEGARATFVSDLLPTAAHLPIPWVMAFDLDPLRTIAEKKRFVAQALQDGRLVLLPHDHLAPLGTLQPGPRGTAHLYTGMDL